MLLTALEEHSLSRKIVSFCGSLRILVNAADIPDLCDFYFNAHVRDGPHQIAFSTNGNGPRMAALVNTSFRSGSDYGHNRSSNVPAKVLNSWNYLAKV